MRLRGLHIWGRSLQGPLILVTLCAIVLLIYTRHKKMSIITKYGTDLYLLLIAQGFWPGTAEMITAQAAHESANFTSKIFRQNNNPFGMKLPETRFTYATGENLGHAVYDDLEAAVYDYWLYYQARKYPPTWKDIDTFIETLKINNYFEAPLSLYKKAVKYFYKIYFGHNIY